MSEQLPNTLEKNDHPSAQLYTTSGDARYYTGIDWMALVFRLLENIHWILLSAILCAAVAGVYAKTILVPIYQTTSKIYIAGSETTISLSDLQLGSSLAKDYQEVFKIWHVHELVDERLGLDYSYSKLAGMVSVSNPDGSHVLYINVKSTDPEEAKLLADTYAEVVQDYIAEKLELRKPQLLQLAQLPSSPISSDIRSTIIKWFVIGGAAASALIVFLYLLDDRIRTGDDVEKATGLATLGVLAKQDEKSRNAAVAGKSAYPPGTHIAEIQRNLSLDYSGDEAINTICSAIMFAGKNQKRLAVTSHEANNGKTYVAMRIAYSMAKRGKKVLLIDCDLRNSILLDAYMISHTDKGLAHYLSGQASLEEAVYPTNLENLSIIPAGEIVKTPLPLLTSTDFEQMMDRLGQEYDLVLVDTPPIGMVIDAAEIAKSCDGSLLVLEYNRQTKKALRYMQRMMEQTQTPIIGCVLNKVTVKKLYQKRYYYQYGGSYLHYGSYGEMAEESRKSSKRRG